ncbi:Protein LTV1 [Zalerion maritima]|uniref:Protein LTV1 n=1 Tax=Zalerion maritima TaxID=339359 RepID=A0AAD5WWH1_9PEZI|nr:Protein LTV1 [Zalerion maritima]
MVKGKWIDKESAVTFKLVHRPQNDPLIHDDTAPSMVLAPTGSASKKNKDGKSVTTLDDLASQLGSEAESIRENEGEAADCGVYYDDSKYDYMQHLRDPGTLGDGVVFMEAKSERKQTKGKGKGQSLEDALRKMNLRDQSEDLVGKDLLPNQNLERQNYQNQQDIQDSIAGFQPDMDPGLREVLEALEDDAYVEDENDDMFQELAKGAKEVCSYDLDDDDFWEGEEGDGWESDTTEKPSATTKEESYEDEAEDKVPELVQTAPAPVSAEAIAEDQNPDWMADFNKFKEDQKQQSSSARPAQQKATPAGHTPNDGFSSIITGTSFLGAGKKKKRKGALTNHSTYSMTSSSLVRTEQQRLLDDRFAVTKAKWDAEMDDRATRTSMRTTVTTAPREDFNAMVDEFLEGYKPRGKSKKMGLPPGGKEGAKSRGVAELDEIRKDLGPALLRAKRQGA